MSNLRKIAVFVVIQVSLENRWIAVGQLSEEAERHSEEGWPQKASRALFSSAWAPGGDGQGPGPLSRCWREGLDLVSAFLSPFRGDHGARALWAEGFPPPLL